MISRYLGGLWLALAIGWPAGVCAQNRLDYDGQPPAPPGTEVPSEPPPPVVQPYVPRSARAPGALPDRTPEPPPSAAEPYPSGPVDSSLGSPEGAPDTQVPPSSPFPPAPPPHVAPADPYAPPVSEPVESEPAPEPLVAEVPTSTPIAPPPPAAKPERRIQAAIMLGLGATFDHTLGGVNPLGFGFGVRGSYQLFDQLTVGGRVMYFVGGSSELPTGAYSLQSWLVAGEAAYPVVLDDVLFQPGLALGVMFRDSDGRPGYIGDTGGGYVPGSQNRTQAGLYVSPGLDVVFPLSLISRRLALFFLGGDTRLDLVFGSGVSANVQLLIQGGLRF